MARTARRRTWAMHSSDARGEETDAVHGTAPSPTAHSLGTGEGADLDHLNSRDRRKALRVRRRRWQRTGSFAQHGVPRDVVTSILSFLPAADMARCGATCHAMRDMCQDGELWKLHYTRDFRRVIPDDGTADPRAVYMARANEFSGRVKDSRRRKERARLRELEEHRRALTRWHWVLAVLPAWMVEPMQPKEALIVANAMRLAILSLLGCVLFSMEWFTGIVWPAVTLYLRLWLAIVAEFAVVGWALASLIARNETTAFARLPRTLFNVGSRGQQVVWVVNALVTAALYTYWLERNGRIPLAVPDAALRVVWAHMWWPVVLALASCPVLFGIHAVFFNRRLDRRWRCMWAAVAIAFVAMQAWALTPVDIVALAAVFLPALRIVECIGIAVAALVGVANVCQGCPRTVAPPFVVALAGAAVLAAQEWLITRLLSLDTILSTDPMPAVRGALHCLNFCVWLVIGAVGPFSAVWLAAPFVVASPHPHDVNFGNKVVRRTAAVGIVSAALLFCSHGLGVDTLTVVTHLDD